MPKSSKGKDHTNSDPLVPLVLQVGRSGNDPAP